MSLSEIIGAIAVALIVSSIGATAGYYLQTRLRRLEELEKERASLFFEEEPLAPAPEIKTQDISDSPSIAASLEITVGLQTGQSFHLGMNTLIGRDPNLSDIIIDDPLVSRQHARIRQERDRLYIYDLASSNGTFVNGESILRAKLHDGDRISMGNTELQFKHA